MSAVVHRCPPSDSGQCPCCGRTPFELPIDDRITLDDALVTCVYARHAEIAAAMEDVTAESVGALLENLMEREPASVPVTKDPQ